MWQRALLVLFFSQISMAQDLPSGIFCDASEEGYHRTGYLERNVTSPRTCVTATQLCENGYWVGPDLYETCEQEMRSCDGQPHGSHKTGFASPEPLPGSTCQPKVVFCDDGEWQGGDIYDSCLAKP